MSSYRSNRNYAANAYLSAPKAPTITFSFLLAFNLCCSLITENSARTRNLFSPNILSNPKRPHIYFSMFLFYYNLHFFYFQSYTFTDEAGMSIWYNVLSDYTSGYLPNHITFVFLLLKGHRIQDILALLLHSGLILLGFQ